MLGKSSAEARAELEKSGMPAQQLEHILPHKVTTATCWLTFVYVFYGVSIYVSVIKYTPSLIYLLYDLLYWSGPYIYLYVGQLIYNI